MRWIVYLALIVSVAALPVNATADQSCPPVPERGARQDMLMEQLKRAPDEPSARVLSSELWRIWTRAPDDYTQALLDRGMSRREALDYDGATEALDALVIYCPNYAEGYNQRAFVQFLRQDYATALEDLERALELSPDHIAAMSGIALTLMGLGRFEVAQSVLRDALALNPWLPERNMLIEPPGQEL
ncbi:MAG: tetratricopeptide repeat protein [Paracoccaceae bacterium]